MSRDIKNIGMDMHRGKSRKFDENELSGAVDFQ
jgi:hypothetical protein